MKPLLFIIAFVATTITAIAQNPSQNLIISGNILDDSNKALELASLTFSKHKGVS